MGAIISAIIAIANAVPIIGKWIDMIAAAIVASRIKAMKADLREAVEKAIAERNQIPLETQVGSSGAGKPSGLPGVIER